MAQDTEHRQCGTYSEIVEAYQRGHAEIFEEELLYYSSDSISETIVLATYSEKLGKRRHSHQYRNSPRALQEALGILKSMRFSDDGSFDELHTLIREGVGGVVGIGPLAIYDISLRIGKCLGLSPDKVYLHQGAKEGARALGIMGNSVDLNQLPKEFHNLSPAQAENCLCIFKNELRGITNR
ncbi:MAG: hypothetical protein WDZ84_02935 [Rhodovibrionaceae bacterium]